MKMLTGFPRASLEAIQQHMQHLGCFTWFPTRSHAHSHQKHAPPWCHESGITQILQWVDTFSSQIWLGQFGFFIPGFYGRLDDDWHQLSGLSGQSGFELCFNPGSTLPLTPSKPLPRWEQPIFKIKTQTLRKAKNPLVIFPVRGGGAVTWIMIN